jgi:hypothetical protein
MLSGDSRFPLTVMIVGDPVAASAAANEFGRVLSQRREYESLLRAIRLVSCPLESAPAVARGLREDSERQVIVAVVERVYAAILTELYKAGIDDHVLARCAGRPVSIARLAATVWNHSEIADEHLYRVCVSALRRKINTKDAVTRIRTIRGEGYMLSAVDSDAQTEPE